MWRDCLRYVPGPAAFLWLTLTLILASGGLACDSSSPTEPRIRADFSFAGEGARVEFKDNSSPGVRAWQWDFGDGRSSIERSPSHNYFLEDLPRRYPVTLKVCPSSDLDSVRCDKVTKTIHVFRTGSPL
ncbi:MAG: PKD domain-containing protein [Acidobacteriota bacterium]